MKKIIFFIFFFTICITVVSQEIETNDNFVKRYYYKDRVISMEKFYGNDKKLDSIKTYYKTGELDEEFHLLKGRFNGLSHKYYRNGKKLTSWRFNNGNLVERKDYKIKFNKKTEEKVKEEHTKLKEVNLKIKENPNDFKSRFKRARIRSYLENKVLALDDFKVFERVASKNEKTKKIPEKALGIIYDQLARLYGSYEMVNYSIHYGFKAIKASPTESRLYHNLGSNLIRNKSYRVGIEFLKKANEMVPNHSFANWILAVAYTDLEEYEKAMTCINIAFKNEKSIYNRGKGNADRDLWTTRGFLYHKLGETDKGIVDLEEALSIKNENSFALRNLGVIYHDIGNYNKSCELLEKAKKLGYEKKHDRFDLQEYLVASCQKADEIKENFIAISEPVKTTKIVDKPYIYPNPAKGIINIQQFDFKKFNYQIFSFEGKIIHNGKAENNSIDVSGLPTGLYLLKVETDGKFNTFKVIKE